MATFSGISREFVEQMAPETPTNAMQPSFERRELTTALWSVLLAVGFSRRCA